MGILDDAIREHLELKRKHGAPSDDVERLEKEAFGPPVRPGDPEFEGDGDGEADAAAEPREELDDPVAAAGQVEDWADALEENTEDHPDVPGEELEAEPPTSAEQGRVEYADLGDTVDHPALSPDLEDDSESELAEADDDALSDLEPEATEHPLPDTAGGRPAEAPEAAIFDEEEEPEFEDFDVDFELEDRDRDEGEAEAAAPPEPAAGEEEPFEAAADEEDDLEDEDEDLLEETPEFLQDAPEGERLWFEQGEPKDFDFDD